VEIVYDPPKRLTNVVGHGLDFADLDVAFFDASTIVPAKQGRWMAIGVFRETVIAVIFTRLGSEAISVISMRSASSKERKVHHG
jgi:uncharacterized DUF497 family protein